MLWKIYLLELFTDKYRPNHVANLYKQIIIIKFACFNPYCEDDDTVSGDVNT